MFTPEEAQELMALIEEAYRTLSHQARRREYDMKIGLAGGAGTSKSEGESKPQPSPRNDPWVGPVKVTTKPKGEVPQGSARTKFSVYKIDEDFEKEIAALEECTGAHLRKIRDYKGVSLDQLSEDIRVTKSTLAALEADDLETLPVAVFTRGFVVQYARVLGLNENKIANSYMNYFKARKVVR